MSPEREEGFRRLAWAMACLVAALGPHFLRMQPWVSAFVVAACGWRLLAERRGWRMPPAFLRGLIENHATLSGSNRAALMLENWAEARQKVVKVFPNEYRRALTELADRSRKLAA